MNDEFHLPVGWLWSRAASDRVRCRLSGPWWLWWNWIGMNRAPSGWRTFCTATIDYWPHTDRDTESDRRRDSASSPSGTATDSNPTGTCYRYCNDNSVEIVNFYSILFRFLLHCPVVSLLTSTQHTQQMALGAKTVKTVGSSLGFVETVAGGEVSETQYPQSAAPHCGR